MERFLPLVYIIGWFGTIFVGSYLINWLLVRSIIRRYYRFFVAPGVIVHELSHALGCLATGSPIVEINFWKASGGHVKHLQPHDPFRRLINDPIIALAPIWGTLVLLAAITWLMFPDLITSLEQSDFQVAMSYLDLSDAYSWLYLYLVTSLIATMAPSSTDMRYALASLVVLSLLLVLILLIPGTAESLLVYGEALLPFALFTLFLLAIGLVVSFILAIPNRGKQFVARSLLE